MATVALLLAGSVFGAGCGSNPQSPGATAKLAEPAIPADIQSAASSLLGSETSVLLFGDLAKNGKREFLAANVVPKTPKTTTVGTIVTRAVIAEEDGGKWTEVLRCDEHLKNPNGFLGLTPLQPVNGWRVQYEQPPGKALTVYFTPLQVNGDAHVLPIAVRYNPAIKRYQSLDRNYEQFLRESVSLDIARSSLR
jgi:hypothetical protein